MLVKEQDAEGNPMERMHRCFERRFKLTETVDLDVLGATVDRGVLTARAPKVVQRSGNQRE